MHLSLSNTGFHLFDSFYRICPCLTALCPYTHFAENFNIYMDKEYNLIYLFRRKRDVYEKRKAIRRREYWSLIHITYLMKNSRFVHLFHLLNACMHAMSETFHQECYHIFIWKKCLLSWLNNVWFNSIFVLFIEFNDSYSLHKKKSTYPS